MNSAQVLLWGREIGAVTWIDERQLATFQYTPTFAKSNIQVAPLTMPLQAAPYEFPALAREAFHGLPGLLADSLPDKFGNRLIDTWLATQGRPPSSMNPVERLCYTGTRGMGALEFKPTIKEVSNKAHRLHIEALVDLANQALDEKVDLTGEFQDILRVGTSAGGARAKAILAWNPATGEFRSGQAANQEGFSHWLIKFDGIHSNRDKEITDPLGFGRIEYAYSLMAQDAGIKMQKCHLHEENNRAHFMTERFDRTAKGEKLHMQSLGAMRHFDFNQAGAYSYEQTIETLQKLSMPVEDVEQQIRRAFFNLIARNQDDHVKNIAFLMNKQGQWRLAPAFDITYAYNPNGAWTGQHQMRLNNKQDHFTIEDLFRFAQTAGCKKAKTGSLLREVTDAIRHWRRYARIANVFTPDIPRIEQTFRKALMP